MTDKREVFFLIGRGAAILWSDTGDSATTIPDSRERWHAIWERRSDVEEIAHSHPVGPARFSSEDRTTMEGIDSGLGKPMRFSVVSPTGMVARLGHDGDDEIVVEEPWWAQLMRRASGMDRPALAKNHDDCVELLRKTLSKQLGKRARIRTLRGADLVVRAPDGEGPAWLVVEVGDLDQEREKIRAYARAATHEYWIIDTKRRCIETHRRAERRAFADVCMHRAGAILTLAQFDEVSICLDDLV